MLIPRAMCMAIERGVRARKWAKIDDEADAAEVAARTVGVTIGPKPHQATAAAAVDNQAPAPSLSVALAGLSLPGNLDPIYDGALYPAIELRTHQGGIRQRSGATLLIASTLRGILHVKLHWDKGTLENEPVRGWWQGIVDGLDALLDG